MASRKTAHLSRKTYGGSALGLLALAFVGLMFLINYGVRGVRADLTQNDLYTLAPGTKQILAELDEPINLYYFFSRETTAQAAPYLRIYAERVRELLEELAARASGRIRLHVIDPQPFSEEEDRAAELGLAAVPLGTGGESVYFGLAGTNSTDGRAVIDIFNPNKEEFLEYDVARLIQQLAKPRKPVVGLLSSLPMTADFNPMTGQMREPWAVISQLDPLVTIRTLEPSLDTIPPDVDALMLVHPKNLSPQALFAIDQFVLRGGHALLFVDPQAQADPAGQEPGNPFGAMGADRSSTLQPLFTAWGIEFDPGEVVVDPQHALMVGMRGGEPPVRHLGILGFDSSSLATKDVITAALDNINTAIVGSLRVRADAGVSMEPLIRSSEQAALLPVDRFAMLNDPATLRDGFRPSGERYTIAARITGKLKSAYPDGKPAGGSDGVAKPMPQAPALKESAEPVNLVIVADTDVLTDPLWVRDQSFFGQRFAQAMASNGDFVANAIDNLTGSSALISVRGRASFVRPFDTVEELRRRAEAQYRISEQRLEEELRATEQKLTELQSRRNDAANLILTPEQEQELERFQQEKLRIRKELREVRHGLAQDIDRLGAVLKAINIGLIPLLICVFALAAWLWRRYRPSRSMARSATPAAPHQDKVS